MLKILLIFGIFIAAFSSSAGSINYGDCSSPSNEPGLCLHIADCQYLYSMLLSNNINGKDKDYLQKSQCGYDNTQTTTDRRVLVCCPHKYCKDTLASTDNTVIQPGNVLPQAGVCGSVLSNRILGGNLTTLNEFPWMALIEYKKPNNQYGFHCGGSLINSRYVLTAGHCVRNSMPEPWEVSSVRLGEWNLDTNPDCDVDIRGKKECAPSHIDVGIERIIVHPHYQPDSVNQFHDIALLRTERSITFTDFVKPICLPVSMELRESNFKTLEVAGWGITEKMRPSAKLLKITVQNWDIADCQTVYRSFMIHLNGTMQFCAGGTEGIDTCRGDSGGPLMVSEQLGNRMIFFAAGVVSYGPKPCGLKNWPGVYTRTGCYIDWIKDNLEP